MEEIGEQLKLAREAMGITIDEAAEDLKLKTLQLESIESGNKSSFKDVFSLKQAIKDYAKYLGLEYEKLENEFNEFVFEYTSKIPLDAIAKASREKNKEKEQTKEITSPYTIDNNRQSYFIKWFLIIFVFIVIVVGGYFVFKIIQENNNNNQDVAFFIAS